MEGSTGGHELVLEAAVSSDGNRAHRRPKRSERAIVRAVREGSGEATEELVRRYWDKAHRAAFLIVADGAAAEDIAQEALLRAIRSIDRFDARRPIAPWLHRIVVNLALDWLRQRQRLERAARAEVDVVADPKARDLSPPLSDPMLAALQDLAPDDRAIVILRHLLGYRPGEIGRQLGLKPATVRTRLHRSLKSLRRALEEEVTL